MDEYTLQLKAFFLGINIKKFCETTGVDRIHLDYILRGIRKLKYPYILSIQEAILTRHDDKQVIVSDLCDKKKYINFFRKIKG